MRDTDVHARLDRVARRTAEALCQLLEDPLTTAETRAETTAALRDCLASGRLEDPLATRVVRLLSRAASRTRST